MLAFVDLVGDRPTLDRFVTAAAEIVVDDAGEAGCVVGVDTVDLPFAVASRGVAPLRVSTWEDLMSTGPAHHLPLDRDGRGAVAVFDPSGHPVHSPVVAGITGSLVVAASLAIERARLVQRAAVRASMAAASAVAETWHVDELTVLAAAIGELSGVTSVALAVDRGGRLLRVAIGEAAAQAIHERFDLRGGGIFTAEIGTDADLPPRVLARIDGVCVAVAHELGGRPIEG